jgi:hypothetical protein
VAYLILLVGLAGLAYWAYSEVYQPRRERRREALARCAAVGHDWGDPVNAMDDYRYPVRHCRRCGHQEHLNRCLACGSVLRKDTHEEVK